MEEAGSYHGAGQPQAVGKPRLMLRRLFAKWCYPGRSWRWARRLSVLVTLVSVQSFALAQFDKSAVAPAVVRVLALVDSPVFSQASQVVPTTAVVLNNQSQLLVRADVVRQAQGVIVLDGGADPDQHGRQASVVYINVSMGVAVLQTNGLQRPALPISTAPVSRSSQVKAVGYDDVPGNPLLIDPAIADGVVSQVNPAAVGQQIQHSAVFVSGKSNGPLVNACNQLAGFNVGVALGGASGVAISGSDVAQVLRQNGIVFQQAATPCAATVITRAQAPPQVPALVQQGGQVPLTPPVQTPASVGSGSAAPLGTQPAAAPSVTPAAIKEAQVLLNALGYPAGPPDGAMGRKTRSALTVYQTANNLPADGQLNDSLLNHLRASLQGRTTVAQAPTQPPVAPPPPVVPPQPVPGAVSTPAAVPIANAVPAPLGATKAPPTGQAPSATAQAPPAPLPAAQPSNQQAAAPAPGSPGDYPGQSFQPWAIAVLVGFVVVVSGIGIWWVMWQKKSHPAAPVERASDVLKKGHGGHHPASLGVKSSWSLYGETPDGRIVNLKMSTEALTRAGGGLVIGRSQRESNLLVNHDSISRQHARIYLSGAQLMIEDLGSVNGTRIDGRTLSPGHGGRLVDGVMIELGEVVLHVSSA